MDDSNEDFLNNIWSTVELVDWGLHGKESSSVAPHQQPRDSIRDPDLLSMSPDQSREEILLTEEVKPVMAVQWWRQRPYSLRRSTSVLWGIYHKIEPLSLLF